MIKISLTQSGIIFAWSTQKTYSMERVSREEMTKYNKETVLSGVIRVCFVVVSIAVIIGAVVGVLGFIAMVL
jgi:hypothetical protein